MTEFEISRYRVDQPFANRKHAEGDKNHAGNKYGAECCLPIVPHAKHDAESEICVLPHPGRLRDGVFAVQPHDDRAKCGRDTRCDEDRAEIHSGR